MKNQFLLTVETGNGIEPSTFAERIHERLNTYLPGFLTVTHLLDGADGEREARRVAAISEAANIIRTLNSNDILFQVNYTSTAIGFLFNADNVDKAASALGRNIDRLFADGSALFSLTW